MAQCMECDAEPNRSEGLVVRDVSENYGPICNDCWSLFLKDETVLSSREAEVAALKDMGYSDMEIGDVLGIERSTVTTIMSRIRMKIERAMRTRDELGHFVGE